MWNITCILWSRWGNKPEGEVWRSWALHPTRWDSMPCYYSSLPTVFLILNYDYIACFPISLRCLDICCSCFVWFIDTIFSWLLLLCRWYMSNPHHMFVYLVGKTTQHHDWVYFHDSQSTCWNSHIHAWFYILWYLEGIGKIHGYALCGINLCEGNPPKITCETYWWWLQGGREIYAYFMSIS